VTGVEFRVSRKNGSSNSPKDRDVRLARNDAPLGASLAKPDIWPASFTDVVYGGPQELWGAGSIDGALLSDLQLAVRMTSLANASMGELDGAALRVHYCVK
jgi:hypothetical protein